MSDVRPRCRRGHILGALTCRMYRGRRICKVCEALRSMAAYDRRAGAPIGAARKLRMECR